MALAGDPPFQGGTWYMVKTILEICAPLITHPERRVLPVNFRFQGKPKAFEQHKI